MIDSPEKLITEYFTLGKSVLGSISPVEVALLAQAIDNSRKSNQTVFVAGNGGSAATASHFATDIGVGSLRRLNPVKVICLNDNVAVLTAVANDVDYNSVFEHQLNLLAQSGDLLILISASGNSENLLKAAEAANKLGVNVLSLTGFNGGKLREITTGRNVHVETEIGSYGLVEDAHMAICHVVTECLRSN